MEMVSAQYVSSDAPLETESKYSSFNSLLKTKTQIVPLVLWGNTLQQTVLYIYTFSFGGRNVLRPVLRRAMPQGYVVGFHLS